jgi:hypothetical protein
MTELVGFRRFEFDLPSALLEQLMTVLDTMEDAPLDNNNVTRIPEAQGVYQIFHRSELVYVGKTDAEAGLRRRLERHSRKTRHRNGLDPAEVSFKAVQILVFSAMDLETALIRRYAERGTATPWNNSGFGSNDPGRERDTTKFQEGHFDVDYPADIDRLLDFSINRKAPAIEILNALKSNVPYVIRFQRNARQPHPDLQKVIEIPHSACSTREVISAVTHQLDEGWQATALPGYVILYKESRIYPSGDIIFPKSE